MATEVAGTLSPKSDWGLSWSAESGGVFEMQRSDEEGNELPDRTGNGVLLRAKLGLNWAGLRSDRHYGANLMLRGGISGSRVVFPEVPHGEETRSESDTRVGGFVEIDYAFSGDYKYPCVFWREYVPGKTGLRIGISDDYVVDGPYRGANLLGFHFAVDLGTRWFNIGPMAGYTWGDDRFELILGAQFSSPVFEL